MSSSKSRQPGWEDWQLTAFVLGELDDALAQQIESAAETDSQLSAEIMAIRQTLCHVSHVLQEEQQGIASRQGMQRDTLQAILAQADRGQVRHATKSSSTKKWIGLLAMSACLLLIAWLSVPGWSRWRLAAEWSASGTVPVAEGLKSLSDRPQVISQGTDAQLTLEQSNAERQGTVQNSSEVRVLRSADADETLRQTEEEVVRFGNNEPEARGLGLDGEIALGRRPGIVGGQQQPMSEVVAEANGNASSGYSLLSKEGSDKSDGEALSTVDYLAMDSSGGTAGVAMGGMGGMRMEGGMGLGMESRMRMGGAMGYGYVEDRERGMPGMGMGPQAGTSAVDGFFRSGRLDSDPRGYAWRQAEASKNRFESLVENSFQRVQDEPLSTFSIDVDTASYAKARQLIMENNQFPPTDAVRIEEFINYFDYDYVGPADDAPFAAHLAVANCPWMSEHKLIRIALQTPTIDLVNRPAANIVFLLDVSGSMDEPNKLPLVKESMRMLVEQLGENDKVAMVVYAGAAGCVLESTRGDKQSEILGALDRLKAGGSTNGGDGIQLAYQLARDHYIPGGINRVILCTDGDFNVGLTSTEALVDLVVENAKSKTFLTVLGYGNGNTNDAMMEKISNQGNGVYAFVDSWREAKRQMVQQLAGNLMTVAKDVKIQVEFNPLKIASYRLLGYENRVMAAEDFNNDKKDAGEVGAGHRVTALYEIVPVGADSDSGQPLIDDLRYQPKSVKPALQSDAPLRSEITSETSGSDKPQVSQELLAVKLRYKQPEGDKSELQVFPLNDSDTRFRDADPDMQWAVSMAQFGMLLRGSPFAGNSTWSGLIEQATRAAGENPDPQREECLQVIRRAAQLRGQ